MKFRKRRVQRVRDELRQWLRSRHGVHTSYTKAQVDAGREELGFTGADDALIAYSLFGSDFLPDLMQSGALSATDLAGLTAEVLGGSDELLFGDE